MRGRWLWGALLAVAVSPALANRYPAPDFTLKSRSGANVRLSELRGQVVMINFWASWCGACRQEMPLLDALYQHYEGMGLTVLGINVERDRTLAQKVLKDVPVSFPILFDERNEVSAAFGVDAMPSTVMVDRDGRLRFVHRGYKPGYEERYLAEVRELVLE